MTKRYSSDTGVGRLRPSISLNLPPEGTLAPSGDTDPIDYYYKPLVGRLYVARINMVLGLLPPQKYGTILELGYGSGILVPSLLPNADRYIGVDIAPPSRSLMSWLDKLDIDTGKVEFMHGDISAVETPPVDLAVAISIFEHVRDLDGLLFAVRGRLRPGGLLLVGMPRVDRIMTWLIERGLRYPGIDDHHVSTFGMFMKAAERNFRVLKSARLPAWLPRSAALYHAALLRAD